ncbi:tetratricopeptide repeat protein [Niabella pedocola]|uniref:Tetratricopeptide repeat protein n=1 Tax=Niabella pedocola TaxID=1752077 RepID=A0ABS8PUQ1_9BACT|nr:tetratricopeptide repeat protein [Niabella pedocola]MCD2424801.1 tetratricopeptide repeat protein [Niabella pedocola]
MILLFLGCGTPMLLSQSKKNKAAYDRIQVLNRTAKKLNSDSTAQALILAHEAYLLAVKENDRFWQAQTMLTLSEGYLYDDSYDMALQYAYDALDIFQSLKHETGIADTYTLLGWIFYDTENAILSMDFHQKAAKLIAAGTDEKKKAVALNAIGLVYQMMNNSDSAKIYFQKTIAISEAHKITIIQGAALNNLGISENALGQYPQAIIHFEKAMEIEQMEHLHSKLPLAEVQNQLAYAYLKLNNYDKADSLLKSARSIIDASTSNTRKEKLLDNLHTYALLHQATGNYQRAFECLQQYIAINNEIVSRNKTEMVDALHLSRETQNREKQINELSAQKELRSFQRNALAAGLVLLGIIGFLLYSRLRRKQQRDKELEAMKRLLIEKELDNTLHEKEALNDKLGFKDQNIKKYALLLTRNDELLKNFIRETGHLMTTEEADLKTMPNAYSKLVKKFLQDLEQQANDKTLHLSSDDAHADFFFNLLQKYPDLTESERKLCAQIRLNLSSKEIAALNNISVKSVEMARYRLRKHFGLQKNEDLNAFISSF